MIDVNKMSPEEFATFQFEMKANMRNKRTGEYHPKVKELLEAEEKKARLAELEKEKEGKVTSKKSTKKNEKAEIKKANGDGEGSKA